MKRLNRFYSKTNGHKPTDSTLFLILVEGLPTEDTPKQDTSFKCYFTRPTSSKGNGTCCEKNPSLQET